MDIQDLQQFVASVMESSSRRQIAGSHNGTVAARREVMWWRVMHSRMALGVMILALSAGPYGSQALGSPLPMSDDRHDRHQDHKPKFHHNYDDELRRIHDAQLSNWCVSVVRHKAKKQFQTDHLSFSFLHVVTTANDMFSHHETVRGSFKVKDGDHKGEKYRYSCAIEGYDPVATISIGSSQERVPVPEGLINIRYNPFPIPRDPVAHYPDDVNVISPP
jgi:hypothetical protein